jgi:hypothetical protein
MEFINFKRGLKSREYCYKYNKIYMYLDFLLINKKNLKILDIFFIFSLLIIYYYILMLQIFIGILFFIPFILFEIKIKDSLIFNVFIYLPYLIVKSLKKIKINKINFKLIFLNIFFMYMWGYPRICFHYSFRSLLILKSYKKDPELINIKKLKEIVRCLYNNTYKDFI